MSCLFEDKSERECSEEVSIYKHIQTDVCATTLEFTHLQTEIHSLAHTLPHGEVVRGHG